MHIDTRALSLFVMAVLAGSTAGCGGGGDGNSTSRSFVYSPVTAEQIAQTKASWTSRDLAPAGVAVYHEDAAHPVYTLRIYEHRVQGRRHYGVVTIPKVAGGRFPVVLFADGLDQGNASMDMGRWSRSSQARLGQAIFVVPVFRGRTLIYNGIGVAAEGDFCDAYDGAADDSIALLNVVQAEFPQADFTRLLARGGSRGGNTALLLGARDDRVSMVSAGSAPVDFYRQDVADRYREQYRCQFFDGLTEAKARERMIASSPLLFPTLPNVTRVFIDHGNGDTVVPLWNATEMEARMRAQGVNVDLRMYDGYGHDLPQAPAWHQRQAEIYELFLAQ